MGLLQVVFALLVRVNGAELSFPIAHGLRSRPSCCFTKGQRDELPRCHGSENVSYFSQKGLASPPLTLPMCLEELSWALALGSPFSVLGQEGQG